MGRFRSLEAIAETKGEILDDLTTNDTAVLNVDQSHYLTWQLRAAPARIHVRLARKGTKEDGK